MEILLLPAAIMLVLLVQFYYAWIASILWGWFLVPRLHLPEIDTVTMFIMMIIFSIISNKMPKKEKIEIDVMKYYIYGPLTGLVFLAIGYILR